MIHPLQHTSTGEDMALKTKTQLVKLHNDGAWDVLRKECQTYGNIISRDNWDSEEGDRYDGTWSLIKILHKGIVWTFEMHNGEIVECGKIGN